MALSLNIPEVAWSTQEVTLGGLEYTMVLKFNTRDKRWRLSLYRSGVPLVVGIKLVESQPLLYRYPLEDFSHGELYVFRNEQDNLPVGRDNLGIGKPYELRYYSNAEIAEIVG